MTYIPWKTKAHALAVLSRVPGGRRLYHFLQRIGGTNRLQVRQELGRAFEIVELVLESGGAIGGATIVEIGTGWRPVVPFILALAGASRVVTLDVNPWLTAGYARETWQALAQFLDEIADRCGLDRSKVRARFDLVPSTAERLDDFLVPLGIDYRCPADARCTGLPSSGIDAVVSSNVLEHIPPDFQRDMHRETFRILKSGGLAVHRFNPQDHFSTVDATITHGNFLQFSARQWLWYGGSGLAYHNRLRCRDYRALFDEAGFETVVDRERLDERTLNAIQSGELHVHAEFAAYTPEELAADYMWMVCRKPLRRLSRQVARYPADVLRVNPEYRAGAQPVVV